MTSRNDKYFDPDPDWENYAKTHGLPTRTEPDPDMKIDVLGDREAVKAMEDAWEAAHPPQDIGYESRFEHVLVRDGTQVEIKIYRPTTASTNKSLPLLFVTHGGGWTCGSYAIDEEWFLWGLLMELSLIVVSVDYRLAPDNPYPISLHDSWDALKHILDRHQDLGYDRDKVILAGSSAGGCLAASMSQQCLAKGIPIFGVLLNVPVTCDPRHFPVDEFEYTSYEQGVTAALLGSDEMRLTWELVVPDSTAGRNSMISPLLGNVRGLPPHLIFVAGQDPLRDEGIAYAEKLKNNGVQVDLQIYQGVPHNFGNFWGLKQTKKFWFDMRSALKVMLSQ